MKTVEEIERSIITTYRKKIWANFIKAINEYKLINNGDKIAVCMSGGKDSFILAKCMQELIKHGKIDFTLEFIVMDPGYNEANLLLIKKNAQYLNIPIHIFTTDIFSSVASIKDSPCYLCARMRRGNLYAFAKELGCNKIALGHHFDDVIETILMSTLYGGEFRTMLPKLHSENFAGMELIRPLYLVREESIISWSKQNSLQFLNCACKFTDSLNNDKESLSKRKEIKELIKDLRKRSPYIEMNLFRSVENVNLDTIISYRQGDKRHHFLDDYETVKEDEK
ncbi:MAG: ATP-binding protein [Bacilli bacterium]